MAGARAVRTASASRPSPDLPHRPSSAVGRLRDCSPRSRPGPTRVRSRWGARLRSSSGQAVDDSALQRPGAAVCRPSPLPDRPEIPAGHRVDAAWSTSAVRPASALSRHDLQISEVGIGQLQGQARFSTMFFMTRVEVSFCTPGRVDELGVVEVWKAGRSAAMTRSR